MALQPVQPGDRITAQSWNDLVREVSDLRTTLDQIMASGFGTSPVIHRILPASPPAIWRVGSAIEILGANFGYSTGALLVTLDTYTVTSFERGSSDTRLVLSIPPLSVPEDGRDVILVVSNGYSATSRTMRILPIDVPIAGAVIDVFWRSVQPNPIPTTGPFFVGYRIRSRAGRIATFAMSASVTSPPGITGLQLFRTQTQELPGGEIQLAPLQEQDFLVRVPQLPAGTTQFTLEAEGTAGSATGSDIRDFPVGSVIVEPDEDIALTPVFFQAIRQNGIPDPAGGSYNHADGVIRVRADLSGIMRLRAEFSTAGSYTVTVEPVGAQAGWVTALSETPSNIVIEAADFAGGASVAAETLSFSVVPPQTTTAGAVVQLQVVRSGSVRGQSRRFQVQIQS